MAVLPPHPNIVRYHTSWIEQDEETDSTAPDSNIPAELSNNQLDHEGTFDKSSIGYYSSVLGEFSFDDFEFDGDNNDLHYNNVSMENYKQTKENTATSTKLTLFIQLELCKYDLKSDTNGLTSLLRQHSNELEQGDVHEKMMKFYMDIVSGVKHLHDFGIIHRDLKPDNIFIHDGTAKIGDFGLATSVLPDQKFPELPVDLSEANELTQHTTALGTYLYASPEQLGPGSHSSQFAKYSEKSDIFALGVILLELCCPFDTMMERAKVLSGVRRGFIPDKLKSIFPNEMDLVLQMTSHNPQKRPSAEEILKQLRAIQSVNEEKLQQELTDLHLELDDVVGQLSESLDAKIRLQDLLKLLRGKVQTLSL